MHKREKRGAAGQQRLRDLPADVRHTDGEEEVVARRGAKGVGMADDLGAAVESIEDAIIRGQKTRDLARMIGPGVAGPLQHFTAEATRADDQDPLAIRRGRGAIRRRADTITRLAADRRKRQRRMVVTVLQKRGMRVLHSVPFGGSWGGEGIA